MSPIQIKLSLTEDDFFVKVNGGEIQIFQMIFILMIH